MYASLPSGILYKVSIPDGREAYTHDMIIHIDLQIVKAIPMLSHCFDIIVVVDQNNMQWNIHLFVQNEIV